MNVALFFGSFNPIHVGHLVIANHIAQREEIDQVWLVVSPHNPLKDKNTLLADYHRLALVKEAVYSNPKMRASDVEFGLEQPNYTIKTLAILKEKYPENKFSLILGEDNLRTFHKWFNHETILKNHSIYVYPRVHTIQELEHLADKKENNFDQHPNVIFCSDAPIMAISSSYIRHAIKAKKEVRYLLTPEVMKYVDEMGFYKK